MNASFDPIQFIASTNLPRGVPNDLITSDTGELDILWRLAELAPAHSDSGWHQDVAEWWGFVHHCRTCLEFIESSFDWRADERSLHEQLSGAGGSAADAAVWASLAFASLRKRDDLDSDAREAIEKQIRAAVAAAQTMHARLARAADLLGMVDGEQALPA